MKKTTKIYSNTANEIAEIQKGAMNYIEELRQTMEYDEALVECVGIRMRSGSDPVAQYEVTMKKKGERGSMYYLYITLTAFRSVLGDIDLCVKNCDSEIAYCGKPSYKVPEPEFEDKYHYVGWAAKMTNF